GGEPESKKGLHANLIISIDGRTARARGVRILLKQPPDGNNAVFEIYVDGVRWMTLVVDDVTTEILATAAQLDAAADIAADANIRVDITGIGTTFPEAVASVHIRL